MGVRDTAELFTWTNALGWLLVGALILLMLNGVLWMFAWGRYAPDKRARGGGRETTMRYLSGVFFARIITEFRHFLALVIVILFGFTLALVTIPAAIDNDLESMVSGIQAVAAGLGGLLGSVIGYYFGESTARRGEPGKTEGPAEEVQEEEVPKIVPARVPARLADGPTVHDDDEETPS